MTVGNDSLCAPLEWKFSQVFGERVAGEDIQNVDIISAIGFDKSGDNLAVGDRGGRVIIFERKDRKDTSKNYPTRNKLEQLNLTPACHPEYQYKTEFQSHEPEFDYLKSLEIEEKINKIKWCVSPNGSRFILSTNDKTIKLWKVKEHKVKSVKEMNPNRFVSSENALLAENSFNSEQDKVSLFNGRHWNWPENMAMNKIADQDNTSRRRCRKVYAHAHDYNINSISDNSDGETFISADDLRINLWNLEISDQCFNIIDMKPSNMEDLTEIITSAEFDPLHCNLLAYSSSRGFIRLVDMRQSALCDHSAILLRTEELNRPKSFFTEIISSISDIKFSSDGRFIISRDYMNLKLWDIHKCSSPVAVFKIHEHLRPRLCELYDNDSIFDRFGCCLSADGLHFATGSYSNQLRMFSYGSGSSEGITTEAGKIPDRKPHLQTTRRARRSSLSNLTRDFFRHGNEHSSLDNNETSVDLNSKLLHLAWHPSENLIACAAGSGLFIYYA
ncbi:serine/threonine protein phosphatase 2A 55 kDa regulatory subunit B beta isoform-like isoform X2 [Benincasa hispida]|uniref:serine/threonine protein phosphatase 2A 55 kDa regulatory subunit B beta isoform-like isoform X2 n=1 Tax=Benincasa hispida TaxID=102211 RepID=UPI0018FFBA46|nr:serine/threonine protein phosphatase 2A 55 kDa regulatory subunit B beta isoform-like isoform X2 [Benincasa hispida]